MPTRPVTDPELLAILNSDSTPPAAPTKASFVSSLLPFAQASAAKSGLPVELVLAQAALESGWGRSAAGNNYFGIKAHGYGGKTQSVGTHEYENGKRVNITDTFRAYDSPEQSFDDHADFLRSNRRYRPVFEARDGIEAARALQKAGYATDPKYADKLISLMESPEIKSAAGRQAEAPAAAKSKTRPVTDPELLSILNASEPDWYSQFETAEEQTPQGKGFLRDMGDAIWQGFVNVLEGDAYTAGRLTGSETVMAGADALKAHSERVHAGMDEDMRAGAEKKWVTEDNKALGEAWGDADAWKYVIGSGLGSIAATILGGGIVKVGARFAVKRALDAGVKREVAKGKISKEAAERLVAEKIKKLDPYIGMGAYGAVEGAAIAGNTGRRVVDSIMEMPAETLNTSPYFQDVYWENRDAFEHLSDQEVYDLSRRQTAMGASSVAMAKAGAVGVLLGTVAGKYLDDAINARTAGGMASRVGTQVGVQGGTESAQAGYEQYAGNEAIQDYANPAQDPWAGTGNAAVGEAIGGGVAGGLLGIPGAKPAADAANPAADPAIGEPLTDPIQRIGQAGTVEEALAAANDALMTPGLPKPSQVDSVRIAFPDGSVATSQAEVEGWINSQLQNVPPENRAAAEMELRSRLRGVSGPGLTQPSTGPGAPQPGGRRVLGPGLLSTPERPIGMPEEGLPAMGLYRPTAETSAWLAASQQEREAAERKRQDEEIAWNNRPPRNTALGDALEQARVERRETRTLKKEVVGEGQSAPGAPKGDLADSSFHYPGKLTRDIARQSGKPFSSREGAENSARIRKLTGYTPVEVKGGWVLRRNQDLHLKPNAPPAGPGNPPAGPGNPPKGPSTAGFTPTHVTPDGTEVRQILDGEGNPIAGLYEDADGVEIEDDAAEPITHSDEESATVNPPKSGKQLSDSQAESQAKQADSQAKVAGEDEAKPPKTDRPKGWQPIGKNAEGETVFEDENGVRSVVTKGVRITETVQVGIKRGGVETSVDPDTRDERFKPASDQFHHYWEWIEDQSALGLQGGGLAEQIRADERLEDGEAEILLGLIEGKSKADTVSKTDSLGARRRVMGLDATLIGQAKDADGMEYQLWDAEKGAVVRSFDTDAGEVVGLLQYPSKARARQAFDDAVRKNGAKVEAKDVSPVPLASQDTGAPQNKPDQPDQDLDALFDEILAEEVAKRGSEGETQRIQSLQNQIERAEAQGFDAAARNARRKIEGERAGIDTRQPDWKENPKPRTAGNAAKSAAKNTAAGLNDTLDALAALFGGNGKLGSGPAFDEDTYAKAKPLFQQAIAHFSDAANDVREAMRLVIQALLERFQDPQMVANMKPYVTRFIAEQKEQTDGPKSRTGKQDADGELHPLGEETGHGDRGDGGRRGSRAAEKDDEVLGDPSPDDVGETDRPGDRRGSGADSGSSDVGDREGVPAGGTAPNGRPGTGGKRVAADGAGGRRGLGNYHIADPEALIGGSPRVRFERNKAAIEAYRAVTEEGREPTAAERDTMAAYIGWGSFGQELFQGNWSNPRPKAGWEQADAWLREHLGQAEWESAQRSIINAHYTDPPTVTAMWDMVSRLGFKGGRVLEPSMGIGNFFGLMPRSLAAKSRLTGIELDELTGGMAKLLYPDANIQIKGYEDSKTADNFYDLVIGNWPFAADGPPDRRYRAISPSLHDYFFLKALDQVRPGGLVIGITSSGTMDKQGRATRLALARKADLVAAFRLPTGAFEKYAGTSVVTDIIILQKRESESNAVADAGWIDAVEIDTPAGEKIRVNQYWQANPDHVLGTMTWGHGTTSGRPGMIVNRPSNLLDRLQALSERLPEDLYQAVKQTDHIRYVTNNTQDRQLSVTVGKDDKLYQVHGEHLAPLEDVVKYAVKDEKTTREREDQVRALIEMRRTYGRLIDAERDGDEKTEFLREKLKRQYDAFVKAHGPLNDSYGLGLLFKVKDPFYPSLAALEVSQNGKLRPARILSEPTVRAKKRLDKPSVVDAFVMARNESMDLDMGRIATLTGKSEDEVIAELTEAGAVFKTPEGTYEVADVYLSGNVRRKLREAEEAEAQGADMSRQIAALKEVLPKDVPYFNIEAKLGAPWVLPGDYQEFIAELLGVTGKRDAQEITVRFLLGSWKVTMPRALRQRPEATSVWGTDTVHFDRLLEAAMNNTTITIWGEDENGNRIVYEEATKQANEKVGQVREEFSGWVWKDAERRIRLEKEYNEVMNAISTARFDGSFLAFEGMALKKGDSPFNLRQHQVDAIWRGLANGRGLYAHEVGTGKTYTMGGIAVESRRYGLARKPLILAHNANSATVAAEINEMYPGAKVLYVDNLTPDRIDITLRQIANDDWDAVVIPHSLIGRLALSRKTLDELAAEQIAALEAEAIEAAADDDVSLTVAEMNDEHAMKKVRSTTAKKLVHARNRIINKIADLAARASKEGAVPFEELGIDMILVDEVHEFKKPPIATKMKMKGLNTASSDQSITLQFLTDYIKRQNAGRGVHIFTGTPITNTLAEIYNMQRYIMDDQMARDGIKDWDAWFNTFADATTDVELTATGEYEAVTRLASFVNVAELRRMIGQYTDIVFADAMPEFKPRPTTSGKTMDSPDLLDAEREQLLDGRTENPIGRPYKKVLTDVGAMSPRQEQVLNHLVQLARSFKQASGRERLEMMKSGDPASPILVETAAANAGLDVRLYDKDAEDHPESKVNRVARNLIKHFKEHDEATQVVFMERGFSDRSVSTKTNRDGSKTRTVKERFNLVNDLVEKLVAGGVPRKQIAIVDGKVSKEKRKQIADAMNRAEIRVVIGNTKTLGVGVNMQRNLRAMHHLDAPWMPGDLEQRNGRGHRQGNQWNTVLEYRYITERLDGRRWQVLAVKDRFIKAFLQADESVRVIEGDAVSQDEGEGVDDLAKTLADAAGDPRILLLNKLKSDVDKLENKERMHSFGVADARSRIRRLKADIETWEGYAEQYAADDRKVQSIRDKDFTIEIAGQTYTERKAADEAIEAWAMRLEEGMQWRTLGDFHGFKIRARWPTKIADLDIKVEGNGTYYIKPSVASLEATLRGIGKRAESAFEQAADRKESIPRLEEAAKAPFARAADLEKKRALLADIEADLQANPIPAPPWLRHGAPVGTQIYVDVGAKNLSPLQVEGHQWGEDNYYVLASSETGTRRIPYNHAKDLTGIALYEPHPFAPPTVERSTPNRSGADAEVRHSRHSVSHETPRGLSVDAVNRIVAAFQRKFPGTLPVKVIVKATQAEAFGAASRKLGRLKGGYDEAKGHIILIAENIDSIKDAQATLTHELVTHFGLRELLGERELREVLVDLIQAEGENKAITRLFDEVRKDYPDVDALTLAEEVLARASEAHADLPLIRKIMAKLMELLRRAGLYWGGMTLADVDGLIKASARNLQKGRQPRDEAGRFVSQEEARFARQAPKAVQVSGTELGEYGSIKELRAKARAYARAHFTGKKVTNRNTGFDIIIPWSGGIKHALSRNPSEDKLLVVPVLPDLLERSTLVGKEPDKQGRSEILAVYKFEVPVMIGKRLLNAHLVVREMQDGRRFYDHHMSELKESAGTSGNSPHSVDQGESPRPATDSTHSIDDKDKPLFHRAYQRHDLTSTLAAAGMTAESREAWRGRNQVNQRQTRVPAVQQAAEDLRDGKITQDEYLETVRRDMPIKPFKAVPAVPTFQEIVGALKADQLEKDGIVGLTSEIQDGTRVGLRLDIPAYDNYDTWIVSVHDGTSKSGPVLGYAQTGQARNVEFGTYPKAALNIATGKPKATIARMFGEWVSHDPLSLARRAEKLMKDPAWIQVGMNPFRHSWFYDKADGMPLTHADEVIQIGALVLAKNARKTTPDDAQFQAGGIKFSRNASGNATWKDALDGAQRAAVAKIGPGKPKTFKEKLAEIRQNLGMKLRQGVIDQYASLLKLDQQLFSKDQIGKNAQLSSWILARMSTSAGGALDAALRHGRLKLKQGAIDVDANGKGLIEVLKPLGEEVDRWLAWVAGNRAEKLAQEDRENLFTEDDIRALKSLNQGRTQDGKNRAALYEEIHQAFTEIHDSVVDVAVETGLINAEERETWRGEFYVPFYRILEEQTEARGPKTLNGLVKQTAYKYLKGGDQQLNDLLGNTLMNWNHLLAASLKNQAAARALATASKVGVAEVVAEGAKSKQAVFVREDGKQVWYEVADPLVLEALTALNWEGFNNPAMKAMRAFKRTFTLAVTASPEFRIANLIRDTVSAAATTPLSTNLLNNVLGDGRKATQKDSLTLARMTAGGGRFSFGHIYGADPEGTRRLIKEGRGSIIDSPDKLLGPARKLWDRYQAFGDRMENVNRGAIFEQALKRNKDDLLRANFEARDLVDFAQMGAWPAVRFLVQTVPFLNARIQGLDKLARSAMDDKQQRQFAMVTAMVALASMALYLAFRDDEDFKAREQWDRDTYWWFKVGETGYRIPKPFEVGAIGTLAERLLEQLVDDKVHGALFAERLTHMLGETFAFNPTPQMFQPALELWGNRDTFTDRPIESMSMARLSPTERKQVWTSQTAIGASQAMDAISWGKVVLSPVQIEHLVQGYLGWVGATALGVLDTTVSRPLAGAPDVPAKRLDEYPILKRFITESPERHTRYVTTFYDQLKSVEQAYGDISQARRLGQPGKARELTKENREELRLRGLYTDTQRQLNEINNRMKLIHLSRTLSAEQKRERIDRLIERRNRLAKRVVERRAEVDSR